MKAAMSEANSIQDSFSVQKDSPLRLQHTYNFNTPLTSHCKMDVSSSVDNLGLAGSYFSNSCLNSHSYAHPPIQDFLRTFLSFAFITIEVNASFESSPSLF